MKVKSKKQNAKDRDRTADHETAAARVSRECFRCEGSGMINWRDPCPDCNGTGEVDD